MEGEREREREREREKELRVIKYIAKGLPAKKEKAGIQVQVSLSPACPQTCHLTLLRHLRKFHSLKSHGGMDQPII
jgi:hypothetical protein